MCVLECVMCVCICVYLVCLYECVVCMCRVETDGKFTIRISYANICRYPTVSDIIKLVLLAIYFKFVITSSAKYSSLSNIDINLYSMHKN